ncbi:MAG: hypothetical protein ABSF82_01100 [Candidatus Bathyarchaeia archaeon]|jgi:predicted GH43/DUF377 family glycosyl hydrolase
MEWHQYKRNPIMALGPQGTWDAAYATWASVVQVDGSNWRMYYSGKNRGSWLRVPRLRIGLAFSRDGMRWEKYNGNPVLDTGKRAEWDSLGVYCPVVWQGSGKWNMIFTGHNRGGHYQIGYAESDDGISWTKSNDNPCFCDPTLGKNRAGLPETEGWGLLRSDSKYSLLYNTVTIKPRQIFVAESTNLIDWTPLSSDPLIPSEGMPSELGYMKYCAWPARVKGQLLVFVATSNEDYSKSALGVWKMKSSLENTENEFLGYLTNPYEDWCAAELDTPFIVDDMLESDRGIRMFYGGRGRNNKWYEGTATAILRDPSNAPFIL